METSKRPTAERIIAVLIMVWGAAWLRRYSAAGAEDWLPLGIAAALGITAITVGLSVWRASPRAVVAYAAWVVADVVALIVLELHAGEKLSHVALGGALAAALFTVFGFALHRARRLRLQPALN